MAKKVCNFPFVLIEYLSIPRSILPSISPAAKAVTLQSRHQGSEPLCTVYCEKVQVRQMCILI